MTESSLPDAGHAFISYVREDAMRVNRVEKVLKAAGIPVWRDTADLWPGEDWKLKIRNAITNNSVVFIACFSEASEARDVSYQNEEPLLAVDQFRLPEHRGHRRAGGDGFLPGRDVGPGGGCPEFRGTSVAAR